MRIQLMKKVIRTHTFLISMKKIFYFISTPLITMALIFLSFIILSEFDHFILP